MYCPKCGAENEEGSLFCQSCGAKLKPEVLKKEKKSPILKYLLIGGGVVVVFFIALVALGIFVGTVVPSPKETLEFGEPSLEVVSYNDETGDARIKYVLPIKNIGEKDLDLVKLFDFKPPSDVVMEVSEISLGSLKAGESKNAVFYVTVKGMGLVTEEKKWEVFFSIRVEIGNSYSESSEFYYYITYTP